jgi:hypothetical protein
MNCNSFFKVLVCLSIITAFSVNPASAAFLGTVNILGHNNGHSDTGNLWGAGLGGGLYYTGVYSWTNAGGTGLGTQVPDWGFCIELPQEPYNGWQNVVSLQDAPVPSMYGTPMATTKANYIRELWGRDFDPAWATGANTQMAEAFGACIWEIIYETDSTWDVTSGAGFHATIEQYATANNWLSQLTGDARYFANNLAATSTLDGQDYVIQIPDYVIQTPEPAMLFLLAAGAVAALRRHTK